MGGSVFGAIFSNSIFGDGSSTNFVSGSGNVSHGHNLSDDAAVGDGTTGPGGALNQSGDIRNTNPLLLTGSLRDNGGFTKTFAIGLFDSSPAIDAGDDGYAPPRDQRGYFRNGRSDIGAFEYSGGLLGTAGITRSGNDAVISAEVVFGHYYQLERKLNLNDPGWTPIGNEFPSTGKGIDSATDPDAFQQHDRAFYRVRFVN